MKEIKAPERYVPLDSWSGLRLFLAGGISNCSDWQAELPVVLVETDLVLFNPRRVDYDPSVEQEQIEWEHQHLLLADAFLFWFCEETVCPITLFELGKVLGLFPQKPLFVGTHPKYSRRSDILFQLSLMRPGLKVVHSLNELSDQVIEWSKQ